jgi:hypothetical protein
LNHHAELTAQLWWEQRDSNPRCQKSGSTAERESAEQLRPQGADPSLSAKYTRSLHGALRIYGGQRKNPPSQRRLFADSCGSANDCFQVPGRDVTPALGSGRSFLCSISGRLPGQHEFSVLA